jgi:hypothetical protein
MPLSHRSSERSHLRLQLVVLLGNPRSRTRGLLQLVLRSDLLPPSYVALSAGLITLTKSTLVLKADRVKIDLKPFRSLRQLVALALHLLGLLLFPMSALDKGHQLLP